MGIYLKSYNNREINLKLGEDCFRSVLMMMIIIIIIIIIEKKERTTNTLSDSVHIKPLSFPIFLFLDASLSHRLSLSVYLSLLFSFLSTSCLFVLRSIACSFHLSLSLSLSSRVRSHSPPCATCHGLGAVLLLLKRSHGSLGMFSFLT